MLFADIYTIQLTLYFANFYKIVTENVDNLSIYKDIFMDTNIFYVTLDFKRIG